MRRIIKEKLEMNSILGAVVFGVTTVICCPFIQRYCQTSDNVQFEKITKDVVEQVSSEQSSPKKSPRVIEQSREKRESVETYEPKTISQESAVNYNFMSHDSDRYQLVDEGLAITTATINYLETCEKAWLRAMTIALSTSRSNSTLPVSNELQKQIPVSSINYSLKSQISDPKSPRVLVANSRTNSKNSQYNYKLADRDLLYSRLANNHTTIAEDSDYTQLSITQTKFMQDMKEKGKENKDVQSTKIYSKRTRKNSLFKRLRKYVQLLPTKFRHFCCHV